MALRKEDLTLRNQKVESITGRIIEDDPEKIVNEMEKDMLDSPKYYDKLDSLIRELLDEPEADIYNPLFVTLIMIPRFMEMTKTEDGKEKLIVFLEKYEDIKGEAVGEIALKDQNYFVAKLKDMLYKSITEIEAKADVKATKKQGSTYNSLFKPNLYSDSEIIRMTNKIFSYSIPMGGMIQSHKQALKKKGWMKPYLFGYDSLFWGRWDYWLEILEKNTLDGSGPIPQIEWSTNHEAIHQVRKMLFKCMDGVYNEGVGPDDFADWLMWGLGIAERPPNIKTRVNKYWYETFDLALVLQYPTDYLSGFLEDLSSRGDKSARGFFATPMNVTVMMNEMVMSDNNPEDMKYKSVIDPCVGCGALLLPASNYSLFGAGQDISMISVKFTKIQCMWYAPWFAINPFKPSK